jgi:hypothetical protein
VFVELPSDLSVAVIANPAIAIPQSYSFIYNLSFAVFVELPSGLSVATANEAAATSYLEKLAALSDDLPPTVFVAGGDLQPVMSTDL